MSEIPHFKTYYRRQTTARTVYFELNGWPGSNFSWQSRCTVSVFDSEFAEPWFHTCPGQQYLHWRLVWDIADACVYLAFSESARDMSQCNLSMLGCCMMFVVWCQNHSLIFGMTETDIRQGTHQSCTQTVQMDSLNADERKSLWHHKVSWLCKSQFLGAQLQ